VEVTFGPEGVDPVPPLSGKLACETLRFLPKWAVVTDAADGLVEVSRSFSL